MNNTFLEILNTSALTKKALFIYLYVIDQRKEINEKP